MSLPRLALAALLALGAPSVAAPHAPETAESVAAPRLVREPIQPEHDAAPDSQPRAAPDFDGRPDAGPTAGQRALWIPRVLLAPLYVTNEYVLRRPLAAVALWGEENRVGAKLAHVLTFGTGGRLGILPTALFDFGLRPSVGLYMFARGVPDTGDRFGLHFAYGGDRWWRASVRETLQLRGPDSRGATDEPAAELRFHFVFDQRPDHLVAEIGVRQGDRVAAYEWSRVGGSVGVDWRLGELDTLGVVIEASRNRFGDGDGDLEKADASLFELLGDVPDARAAAESLLAGFDGYELVALETSLNLDSRPADTALPGSGVRLRLTGGVGTDAGSTDRRWADWGAELGLYADMDGRGRVLSLNHRLQVNEPLTAGAETPFAELPTLGGTTGLRGFVEGRVRGPSTWLSTLQYTYPVAPFVDGFVFYEVGNAFAGRLDDFSPAALASSFGLGLQTTSQRDVAFSLLVAAGTVPFDAPDHGVESARVVVGAQRGF